MGRTGDSLENELPHEVGEEALSKRNALSGESVPWNGGVMVVVVVVESLFNESLSCFWRWF